MCAAECSSYQYSCSLPFCLQHVAAWQFCRKQDEQYLICESEGGRTDNRLWLRLSECSTVGSRMLRALFAASALACIRSPDLHRHHSRTLHQLILNTARANSQVRELDKVSE